VDCFNVSERTNRIAKIHFVRRLNVARTSASLA
jgi:hypothetical protein